MFFIFVSNDIEVVSVFEKALRKADADRKLVTVSNGYDLIQYLQNVKKGESYPDLIILTPEFLRISGTDLLQLLKTDDFYRLIPVVMLMPESNDELETLCNGLNTAHMLTPKNKREWMSAVDKMYTACS